jgi:hypothetical protein
MYPLILCDFKDSISAYDSFQWHDHPFFKSSNLSHIAVGISLSVELKVTPMLHESLHESLSGVANVNPLGSGVEENVHPPILCQSLKVLHVAL